MWGCAGVARLTFDWNIYVGPTGLNSRSLYTRGFLYDVDGCAAGAAGTILTDRVLFCFFFPPELTNATWVFVLLGMDVCVDGCAGVAGSILTDRVLLCFFRLNSQFFRGFSYCFGWMYMHGWVCRRRRLSRTPWSTPTCSTTSPGLSRQVHHKLEACNKIWAYGTTM